MGWSDWDFQGIPLNKNGQEIIIPSTTKLVGFDYYEHPGDAMSNIRLVYLEGTDEKVTPYSGDIYGGEIIDRKNFPEDPTLKVVGVNTRILYGYSMSDIQFIYTYGNSDQYTATTDWCRPYWTYNESYSLRASPGWVLDGIQVGIAYGDAVAAVKIHTRQ